MTQAAPFSLGTFSAAAGAAFAGVVIQDRVIALHALAARVGALRTVSDLDVLSLLRDWARVFPLLQNAVTELVRRGAEFDDVLVPLGQLHVHAPVPAPGTIYCSGANYKKHVIDLVIAHGDQAETAGMSVEEKRAWGMKLMDERAKSGTPFIFIKPQSTVTGPFDPVIVPFDASKPDWELELGVVIGKRARRVSRANALDYVAGYTIVNDITLREKVFRKKSDSPELGMDFAMCKGAPTFLPMGPFLVPAAFVGDPQKLRITLKLNGDVMQDEETSDMIFSVAHLLEYLSASVELQPGDVICTGSPAGNGMHYNRFIQEGDVLEGSISGLGTQRNPCRKEENIH